MRATLLAVLVVIGLAACEGNESAPPASRTQASPTQASPTTTPTARPTPTPTATPTAVPTLGLGANIAFMGVLRADDTLLDPADFDEAGRPVYVRPTGSGFVLVIDARPGTNSSPVGLSAYQSDPADPSVRPDLQIEVSRDLGNGSPAVCDNTAGNFGGVPGIDPPSFEETQRITDALNDFGCRFNDGTGMTLGRDSQSACVLFPDGEFHFVDPTATIEFCGFITRPMAFPTGDTIVTARLRDRSGLVGPARQIVIRVSSPPSVPASD